MKWRDSISVQVFSPSLTLLKTKWERLLDCCISPFFQGQSRLWLVKEAKQGVADVSECNVVRRTPEQKDLFFFFCFMPEVMAFFPLKKIIFLRYPFHPFYVYFFFDDSVCQWLLHFIVNNNNGMCQRIQLIQSWSEFYLRSGHASSEMTNISSKISIFQVRPY